MPQPKVIFFDLDETLVRNTIPVPQLFAEMYHQFSEQLGAENKDSFFAALRNNASQLWETMFDRSSSPESQFADCFASSILATGALNEQKSQQLAEAMLQRYAQLSANNVMLHDGALEVLAELSERGFSTGIITNGMELMQLGKINQLNLHEKVDHVIVSAQARAHKPHRQVFDHALNKAGVAAAHAWQVGDHATNDVAGAIRAGMSGIFYDPSKTRHLEAFNELEEKPTHIAHHLLDVVDLAARA